MKAAQFFLLILAFSFVEHAGYCQTRCLSFLAHSWKHISFLALDALAVHMHILSVVQAFHCWIWATVWPVQQCNWNYRSCTLSIHCTLQYHFCWLHFLYLLPSNVSILNGFICGPLHCEAHCVGNVKMAMVLHYIHTPSKPVSTG